MIRFPGAVSVGASSHVHVFPSSVNWPPPPAVPREEKSVRRAILVAGGDGDHPGRLLVVAADRAGIRAGVAGREDDGDPRLERVVGRPRDRVGRVDRRAGVVGVAPRVRDHVDPVAILVRDRVVEAADHVEDRETGAGAVADELRARRDALVLAVRARAGRADDAGDVGAVPAGRVGVLDVLDVGDRRELGERVQVRRASTFWTRCGPKRWSRWPPSTPLSLTSTVTPWPATGRLPFRFVSLASARTSSTPVRFVDVALSYSSGSFEHHRRDERRGLERIELRRGREHAGDRQRLEGEAGRDPGRLEQGDVGCARRAFALEGDDGLDRVERGAAGGAGARTEHERGESEQERQASLEHASVLSQVRKPYLQRRCGRNGCG